MRGNLIYQALRNVSTELYVVSFLAMYVQMLEYQNWALSSYCDIYRVNAPYYFEKLHEKSRRNVYIGDDVTTTVTQSTSVSSRDSEALEMFDRKATINEIGLPLFNKRVSPILQVRLILMTSIHLLKCLLFTNQAWRESNIRGEYDPWGAPCCRKNPSAPLNIQCAMQPSILYWPSYDNLFCMDTDKNMAFLKNRLVEPYINKWSLHLKDWLCLP